MQHELTNILYEHQNGTLSLPSESENIISESNLRSFLIQHKKLHSTESIISNSDSWELKVKEHSPEESPNNLLAIAITIQPKELSIEDFIESIGENFFDQLVTTCSKSKSIGTRGNRACFISSFEKTTSPIYGEVLTSKILISTSVYYNDYRVTVNFPDTSDTDEITSELTYLYNSLQTWHDSLKIELEYIEI